MITTPTHFPINMNILLVEDDFYLSELLTEVLTEFNFVVKAVSNGLTPLKLVEKYQYDLIILNVFLPKLNGIDLCRQLRTQGYYKPIVFWSSQDFPEFQQAGMQAGADDYLPKPCKISTLLKHINKLLNYQPTSTKDKANREELEQKYLQFA